MRNEITFFDHFAGIGGFRLALEYNGFKCVGACEIDRYAREIYKKHWEEPAFADSTEINPKDVPDHDILCAGFPCQPFSVAGNRLGFNDTRGTLFFEICRIAEAKRPRILFLENVKGLLFHDRGRTFARILLALDELGYDVEWQVINSKYFLPQNRERAFIIGHLREEATPKIFPLTESGGLSYTQVRGKQKDEERLSSTIDSRYGSLRNSGETYILKEITTDIPHAKRIYDASAGLARTLIGTQGGNAKQTGYYAIPILTLNDPIGRQNGRRMKDNGDPSFTLTSQDRHGVYDGKHIRKFTPLETERLQGFPDNWTEGISDSQRYKSLGNAVTVPVVQCIGKSLKRCLS